MEAAMAIVTPTPAHAARRRLVFYCQHSVGLGHLVRSLALSRALTERFEVVLLCGGTVPDAIATPPGVRLVELPPVGVGADGAFASHDPELSVERARMLRRQRLIRTLHAVRPDVLLIELFPFGRARFARELVPLLEEAWSWGHVRPLVACSLRDILVRKRERQADFDDRAARLANRYFDAVLVHAERRLAPLEESFRPATRLQVPVHYTGYVAPNGHPAAPPVGARERRVVVSAGGGLVGEPLMRAALGAHRLLWPTERLRTTLIAGPFLPEAAWAALAAEARDVEGLELLRTVPDLADELATAGASISQCGYNTTLEVLRARLPALVVPYATPTEDEQSRRAERLAALGALRALAPERLSAAALADELRTLVDFRPAWVPLDLDGARRTAATLESLVTEHQQPATRLAASGGSWA
jgi:predicted glycosyltransferase